MQLPKRSTAMKRCPAVVTSDSNYLSGSPILFFIRNMYEKLIVVPIFTTLPTSKRMTGTSAGQKPKENDLVPIRIRDVELPVSPGLISDRLADDDLLAITRQSAQDLIECLMLRVPHCDHGRRRRERARIAAEPQIQVCRCLWTGEHRAEGSFGFSIGPLPLAWRCGVEDPFESENGRVEGESAPDVPGLEEGNDLPGGRDGMRCLLSHGLYGCR